MAIHLLVHDMRNPPLILKISKNGSHPLPTCFSLLAVAARQAAHQVKSMLSGSAFVTRACPCLTVPFAIAIHNCVPCATCRSSVMIEADIYGPLKPCLAEQFWTSGWRFVAQGLAALPGSFDSKCCVVPRLHQRKTAFSCHILCPGRWLKMSS